MNRDARRESLAEAKQRLPLPQLMEKLGDGQHAKKSAKCPFHEDRHNSFSIFKGKAGDWRWKCHAGCGTGDGVDYLEKRFGLSTRDAIARYCAEAGVNNGEVRPAAKARKPFDWQHCVDAFTGEAAIELATWRGLSPEFVHWLHSKRIVGLHDGNFAFAVHNQSGKVVSCHKLIDREKRKWVHEPKGRGTHPLLFGDTRHTGYVLCFESQWDAFAVMDKLGWDVEDGLPDTAVLITRGSENGKLIAGHCSADVVAYAFVQNDAPKADGSIPAERWLADVAAHAGCTVLRVTTPAPHKDANDWTRASASKAEIEAAIGSAKIVDAARAEPATTRDAPANFDKLTAWIRGQIVALLLAEDVPSPTKRSRIAKQVVEALEKLGRFYFHTDLRDFDSAMFFDSQRKRLERIRSDGFGAWLSEWLNVNRADTLFRFILAEVESAALSGAHTLGILPESFWAASPGALYLSNGDGSAVRITAGSVELVDNGSDGVLFAAGRTLQRWQLTEPRDFFQTCRLFADMQDAAPNARELVRLWTLSLPTNPRSKPPLCLFGEVGSGKTRLALGICELYGLPPTAAKVEERLEADFWPTLDAGGLFILDNADSRTRWLADAVAAAATGGSVSRRRLYTDAEIVPLRARAWLAITSANPTFANDSGLADRLLVVRVRRREGTTSDSRLSAEIAEHRDAALSFVAHTLAGALGDTRPTPDNLNTRHPDFAAFAIRIGRALGREAEAVAALGEAEADKSLFCLQNDTLGAALLAHVTSDTAIEGDAAELRTALAASDTAIADWSNKSFGRRLSALWPHVAAIFDAKRTAARCGWKFRIAQRTNAALRL